MLFRILLSIFALSMISGCSAPHYVDYFPYHDDGTVKPHVVFVPVINNSNRPVPASLNLSSDSTLAIRYHLMDSGKLFLFSPEDVQAGLNRAGKVNFFESDGTLAQQFCDADFIVFIELIDPSTEPMPKSAFTNLILKARIKIVDVRRKEPQVALQEIMSCEYTVSSRPGVCEGEDAYYRASIGKSYHTFSCALSQRIEEIILSVF